MPALLIRWTLTLLCALLPAAAAAQMPDRITFGIAVEAGDLGGVQRWLDQGLPANFEADRIGTGLMIGAWEGNIPMMQLFLDYGANINRANANGEQALMHAAWRGHKQAVLWLLERGARIDRDGRQWSALHYAAFAGHEEVLHLLLARGANVNARAPNGTTPLMMAAREGHQAMVGVLMERGADPDLRNDAGDDALAWAIRRGYVRIAQAVSAGKPQRFSEAARAAPNLPPPVYSVPAPSDLAALVEEMRAARAAGRSTDEVLKRYEAMLKALKKAPAPKTQLPAGLEITGNRADPSRERAKLYYEAEMRRRAKEAQ